MPAPATTRWPAQSAPPPSPSVAGTRPPALDDLISFAKENNLSVEQCEALLKRHDFLRDKFRPDNAPPLAEVLSALDNYAASKPAQPLPPQRINIGTPTKFSFGPESEIHIYSGQFKDAVYVKRLGSGQLEIIYNGKRQVFSTGETIVIGNGNIAKCDIPLELAWRSSELVFAIKNENGSIIVSNRSETHTKTWLATTVEYQVHDDAKVKWGASGRIFRDRQGLLINPNNKHLRKFYADFLAARRASFAPGNDIQILSQAVSFVRSAITGDDYYVDYLSRNMTGEALDFGDYFAATRRGVCVHYAIFAAYLAERLRDEGYLPKATEVAYASGPRHGWAFAKIPSQSAEPVMYVLDPAQRDNAIILGDQVHSSGFGAHPYRHALED